MRRQHLVTALSAPILIVAVAAAIAARVASEHDHAMHSALESYRSRSRVRDAEAARLIDSSLTRIYEGLRTIARLPGVQKIDATAANFDADARSTVQEIYNNLASGVAVSELYIVPVDLAPDATDPADPRPREPITTFDELIVERHADQHPSEDHKQSEIEEIEIHEYRLMARQLAHFREKYPTQSSVHGLEYPILAGPQVVTCDNTRYSPSKPDDQDRSGLVFSVPFYGPDGTLKGCISAVILTGALQELLPDAEYAIHAGEHSYVALGRPRDYQTNQAADHLTDVLADRPVEGRLYSNVTALAFKEGQASWKLWRARPDEAFYRSNEVESIRWGTNMSYAVIAGFGVIAIGGVVLFLRRIEQSRRYREELERQVGERTRELSAMVLTDKLTGLPNRAMITEQIDNVLARSNAAGDYGYAVLFLDFDRFKIINDTMGHEAGDELLRSIAARLRSVLRAGEAPGRGSGFTPARLGGDEFVVLLESLHQIDDSDRVASRLVAALEAPHQIAGQEVISTASIGVVRGDARYERATEILRDADTAMYEAKAAGKGRYVVFDTAMRERILRRASLDQDLRSAIARGELELLYQPVVRVESGEMVSVEALVRWNHPRFGRVSPVEFIPIGEESGSIGAITDWVTQTACAQLAAWQRTLGVAAPKVAINISRVLLANSTLPDRLLAIAERHAISPAAITLEITETAIVRDHKTAVAALERLKAAGFGLSLDDFGTGYSSLSTLHEFPLDVVKLDRSFIASASLSRERAALVHAVIALAYNLGMAVVAEGVETPEQIASLQAMDCHFAQGYLFGRPLVADRITEMATRKRKAA